MLFVTIVGLLVAGVLVYAMMSSNPESEWQTPLSEGNVPGFLQAIQQKTRMEQTKIWYQLVGMTQSLTDPDNLQKNLHLIRQTLNHLPDSAESADSLCALSFGFCMGTGAWETREHLPAEIGDLYLEVTQRAETSVNQAQSTRDEQGRAANLVAHAAMCSRDYNTACKAAERAIPLLETPLVLFEARMTACIARQLLGEDMSQELRELRNEAEQKDSKDLPLLKNYKFLIADYGLQALK